MVGVPTGNIAVDGKEEEVRRVRTDFWFLIGNKSEPLDHSLATCRSDIKSTGEIERIWIHVMMAMTVAVVSLTTCVSTTLKCSRTL